MSISENREGRLESVLKRFTNCTKIEGNLEVAGLPLVNVDLSSLSTIVEVTGYVLFYDTNLTTLPLANLKLIRGENLFESVFFNFFLEFSFFLNFILVCFVTSNCCKYKGVFLFTNF